MNRVGSLRQSHCSWSTISMSLRAGSYRTLARAADTRLEGAIDRDSQVPTFCNGVYSYLAPMAISAPFEHFLWHRAGGESPRRSQEWTD